MTQSPPSPVISRRNKLLMQLLAFIALAVVLYYRPQIEAWVSARQSDANSTASTETPSPNPDARRPRLQPQLHPAGPPNDFDAELPGGSILPGNTPDEEDADTPAPAPRKRNSKRGKGDVAKKPEAPKDESTSQSSESTNSTSGSEEKGAAEIPPGSSSSNSAGGPKDGSSTPEDVTEPASDKYSPKSKDTEAGEPDVASSENASPESTASDSKESKKSDSSSDTKSSDKKKSEKKSSVSRMEREPAPKRTAGGSANDIASKKDGSATEQNPDWGQLKEIRNNVFESTAGLVYRSGSVDGHRLKHVMEHAKDNTSKPVHGVFIGEGDRGVVLALIDEAFEKAKKGGKDIRKENEGERLVYTVNMKRQVGFMGGQAGERRGNPECRFIRIVLENENEVISAFPTDR